MNIEELKKYAFKRGLNLGQAEKDYYQNIVLFIIYSNFSKELVFKGGTALSKCYGLNRFSEDLDFSVVNERDFIGYIDSHLDDFEITHYIREIKAYENKKYRIKIEGPLHKNSEKTLCSITIDLSFREKVILEPLIKPIGRHMDIIPLFDVYVMDKKEIFAEKVRAIMMRKSARDLYDIGFLLDGGSDADYKQIDEKLKFAGIEFNKKVFISRCINLKTIWQNELKSLVRNVPEHKEYIKKIKKWLD